MGDNIKKATLRICATVSGLVLAVCCVAALLEQGERRNEQASLEQESLFVYGLPHPNLDNPLARAVSRFEQEYATYMQDGTKGARLAQALQHAQVAKPVALQEGGQHAPITGKQSSGHHEKLSTSGDGLLRVLLGKAGAQVENKFEKETNDKDKVMSSLNDVEDLLLRPESKETAMQKILREIDEKEKV
jgi:hypothetical protein